MYLFWVKENLAVDEDFMLKDKQLHLNTQGHISLTWNQ